MPTERSDHATVFRAPEVRVLAAVIVRDDRYLICQRPSNKRHGGLWEFPGGKVEVGESDADAARRELREELALEAIDVGSALCVVHDEGSPFWIAFVPVRAAGEPRCLEHMALAWVTPRDLPRYPLAPSDARFVTWLREMRGMQHEHERPNQW